MPRMNRRWPRIRREPGAVSSIALGRLPNLEDNRGRGAAPLVWLGLASHLRWGSKRRNVHCSNERLARVTGLSIRAVEYAIGYLKRAGKLVAGYRKRGRYSWGRVLRMEYAHGPAPRVILPKPAQIRALWSEARKHRSRACAIVTMAIGAHVLVCAEFKHARKFRACSSTVTDLGRLLGSQRGGHFSARLAVLATMGIFHRLGRTWRGGFGLAPLRFRLALPRPPMRRTAAPVEPQAPAHEEALAVMSEAFARLYSAA